ncbi:YfbU family protein [Lacicoccus alkaliphilus]|uniref:YfbU domain-containing protein n=1 Tax=Lacicoccus alkaliphilus DSM 16010 TaxID=1123231 RepID=A0A1M7HQA4_9BACL|nr:YfbU family protein [Salinicoccus alkaliphilus]SHM30307.1 YfbU domain-containing protein [Salinicoccus alkaliphilus DSM 16010]
MGTDDKPLSRKEERLLVYLLLMERRDRYTKGSENYRNYEYYIDIVINGIESKYNEIFEHVHHMDEGISKKVSEEVEIILTMYHCIETSFEFLSHSDQQYLRKKYIIEFAGFRSDIESEHKYLSYYRFLKKHEQQKLPRVIENPDMDIETYRKMLLKFKDFNIPKVGIPTYITKQQLVELFSVQEGKGRIPARGRRKHPHQR